jgi:ankyrin repeat protein
VDVAKILEEAPARGEFSRSGSTYTQGDSIQRSFFEGPQSGPPEHPVVRESPNADLLDAAVGNDLARATAALQKGASVDARNRHGNTALMIASEMGYPKMVELLVQKGANVNLQGEFGFTALTCAAMAGEQAITEFLIRNQANREIRCTCHGAAILSLAIRRGRDEIVQSLIKAGVNIETKDNYRWTPLIWAASFGRSQAVKLLLENGAKTNSRCSTGETALDWAKKRGHDEVVRILSGDIIRISR